MRLSLGSKNSAGFTLVEILIVITVLGILSGLSINFSRRISGARRASSYINLLSDLLVFARMSAVVHNERIMVCYGPREKFCHAVPKLGLAVVNQQGEILRSLPSLPAKDDLWLRMSGHRHNSQLIFEPTGLLDGHSGSFTYCPGGGAEGLALIFNRTGRTRISKTNAHEGRLGCRP